MLSNYAQEIIYMQTPSLADSVTVSIASIEEDLRD